MSQPPPNKVVVYFESETGELYSNERTLANVDSLEIRPQGCIPVAPLDPNRTVPDPFLEFSKEFPEGSLSLKSLELFHYPLFSSICNIKTLTKFVLHHHTFLDAPKTILAVFKENPSLEEVALCVKFLGREPGPENLEPEGLIELNRLESLSVQGCRPEDAVQLINLISGISFPEGALVMISTSDDERLNLGGALSSIEHFATPPTHLLVDYLLHSYNFPGPNESEFRVSGHSCLEMTSALKDPLPFLRNVQHLHLGFGSHTRLQPLELSPFPSLKTLIIESHTRPQPIELSPLPSLRTPIIEPHPQISTTLSKLLSSPETFQLDHLEIRNILLCDNFQGELKQFASKIGYDIWLERDLVILIRRGANQSPSMNTDNTKTWEVPGHSVERRNVRFEEEDSQEFEEADEGREVVHLRYNQWQSLERFVHSDCPRPRTRSSQSWPAALWGQLCNFATAIIDR